MRTLFERQLREWRLAPWLAYVAVPLIGVGVGELLLARGADFSWAIVLAGLSWVRPLSGQARNDFLRALYRGGLYRRIRLAENGLVLLPFVLYLLVKGFWAGPLVLGGVGMSGVWWTDRPRFARGLPTPFSARPFEFAAGFRQYWWVLAIAAFLLFQSVRAANYELGGFALGVVALLGCHIVQQPEPGFYVWIYPLAPEAFLRRKTRLLLLQHFLLMTPFALVLLLVFPEQWWITLSLLAWGAANLVYGLYLKYSHFPFPLNVHHGFLFALGLLLPPTLLILIPLYYQRASARLSLHLPHA